MTAKESAVIQLRLGVQQASLLVDVLADLEAAIWDVHGDQLALLAQAEADLDVHLEAEACDTSEPDPSDDIPF